MLINEWKAQEHLFFSLSPAEMERFDDKNSLNGGFFAILEGVYTYIEVFEEEKKNDGELFMLQAQSWFTVVQRH